MEAYKVIARRTEQTGISVSELARRTGLNYFLLRLSLRGERRLLADELVVLCKEFDLEMSDFDAA